MLGGYKFKRYKKTHKSVLPYNRKTAFSAAISLSLAMSFIIVVAIIFFSLNENSKVSFSDLVSVKSIVSLLFNIAFVYYLFIIQFRIVREFSERNNRFFSFLLFILLFLIVVTVSPIVSRIQWRLLFEGVPNNFFIVIHLVRDLVVLFMSFLYTSLIVLFNKNQENVLENKNLEIENLQNRYNMLKSQIDPHFLFNSLNTLNGLIDYDTKRAKEYVNQLSQVFRYTMQANKVVMLSEELKFAQSYIYMLKIRYNDALKIDLNIDSVYNNYYIMPSALQVLIENAVKHNVVSQKQPLVISIATTDNATIIVENNIQQKRDKSKYNGLGLSNLNERYWLMFGKNIKIENDSDTFAVEVPLIDKIKNE